MSNIFHNIFDNIVSIYSEASASDLSVHAIANGPSIAVTACTRTRNLSIASRTYGMGRLLDISPNGWRLINVYSDDVYATRLEFDELAIPRIHRCEDRLLNVDARCIEYRTAHKCYGYVNGSITNVIGV